MATFTEPSGAGRAAAVLHLYQRKPGRDVAASPSRPPRATAGRDSAAGAGS